MKILVKFDRYDEINTCFRVKGSLLMFKYINMTEKRIEHLKMINEDTKVHVVCSRKEGKIMWVASLWIDKYHSSSKKDTRKIKVEQEQYCLLTETKPSLNVRNKKGRQFDSRNLKYRDKDE